MPFWNEAWSGEAWHRIAPFATSEAHSKEAVPNLTWVVRRSVLVLGSRLMFSPWNVYAHVYPVSLIRLIKLLNKHLWLMRKTLSCSSGVVPVFCGLGSPGKWTVGVRECELVSLQPHWKTAVRWVLFSHGIYLVSHNQQYETCFLTLKQTGYRKP